MTKIFSGTANENLSKKIAESLKLPLARSEIVRFANSEVKVRIIEAVKDETCIVIQSTSNPTDTHLIELLLFCDALLRQEAKKVIGVIPYFGYARQNIQHREGECVSANVVIRFLETIGFSKIYTIDLHDEATEGVFSIPFKNLSALPLLAEEIKKYLTSQNIKITPQEIAIVSPDQGGIERARKFGTALFGNKEFPLTVVEKTRNLEKIHTSKAIGIYGEVKNKIVILVDDIITSGGTLINAVELCLKAGAKRAISAIVHHDFSKDAPLKLQNSPIEKIFTTDTILLKPEEKFEKLKEISVANLIAKELKNYV